MGLFDEFNPDNYTGKEIEIVERLLVGRLGRDLLSVKLDMQERAERYGRHHGLRKECWAEDFCRWNLEQHEENKRIFGTTFADLWAAELDTYELEIANRILMAEIGLPITCMDALQAPALSYYRRYDKHSASNTSEWMTKARKEHEAEQRREKEYKEAMSMLHSAMTRAGKERYPELYE